MTETDNRLRRLLEVGRSLVSELDPDAVLEKILAEARALTGARYAALGVLNEDRTELARFLTVGLDPHTRLAIGELPHGRGVLGALIVDPKPLRLEQVGHHPDSYGFPAAHPVMETFLGVPVLIRGQAWGNLYLTDKQGGEPFTGEDEDAAVLLAGFAAVAIENARLYRDSERRREQLEQAVHGLEAARDIAEATGGHFELERILDLIAKRGRALVSARSVLIMLREADELVVRAVAGDAQAARGRRLPVGQSTSGQVLSRGRAELIPDVRARLGYAPEKLGMSDVRSAALIPMLYHGSALGVLAAFDRARSGTSFSAADEELLKTFASSAANVVAISRSVEADRLRSAIAAAEAERRRWARELHDETLQALGGLRVMLASALRRADPGSAIEAMEHAVADIEREIENLRAIISDLRPSLLDDLGLQPAIEALLERRREGGLEIAAQVSLATEDGRALAPELETTVYRLVQEALTNVVKHARASRVSVRVSLDENCVVVEVADDGVGFDADAQTGGFGLAGIRERVFLAGGELELESSEARGTRVRATIALSDERAADTAV